MAPTRIIVEGVGGVKLSSNDDLKAWTERQGGRSLVDSDGDEVGGFDTLEPGGKYTLGPPQQANDFLDEREKKRSKTTHTEVVFSGTEDNKKSIPLGELADRFGGLLDRESSKQQLYEGLLELAKNVGLKNLDKKDVPLLGISGGTESGKTEFLKWIFNHCCTFSPRQKKGNDNNASNLLQKINEAIPDERRLDKLLVLFASFNQTSCYMPGEGPIVATTVERLLRSFDGDLCMTEKSSWKDKRFGGFSGLQHIMSYFDKQQQGNTGFIFCVDELSKLRQADKKEYQILMDSLLQASQERLQGGGFCAIVGSSLSVCDFGETVLQLSGRAVVPIQFPSECPEMMKGARDFVHKKTDVFNGASNNHEIEEFYVRVTTSVLESKGKLRAWNHIMRMKETETRVRPPVARCKKPDALTYDDIFLLVAQGLFERDRSGRSLDREKLHAVVNDLGGSVIMTRPEQVIVTELGDLMGQMTLPAWRLLEFEVGASETRFKWVKNWVLVETRKLFYEYGPAESTKMWELATMGVLELRRAMLLACNRAKGDEFIPSLKQIVEGLGVHHNLGEELFDAASKLAAAHNELAKDLGDTAKKTHDKPCFFYAIDDNEPGVEGMFKGGFDIGEGDVCIFFQMKMYTNATPGEISKWLQSADKRAQDLGLQTGRYIVQLFVTGALEHNIEKRKIEWPKNCMVFGTASLRKLFEPFGKGIIEEIIRLKNRDPIQE